MKEKPMIGQRVILTGQGGKKEIGMCVVSESYEESDDFAWVYSPTNKFASCYALESLKALPGGQL